MDDRESSRDGLRETAGRVRVAGREGDEVRPFRPPGPLDGHDPAGWSAFRVHLVPGLLEDAIPYDRVPDRILLDERAKALPIRDGVRGRGPAMPEAGERLPSARRHGAPPRWRRPVPRGPARPQLRA